MRGRGLVLFAGSTVIAGCAIVGALAPTARPSGSPVPSTMLGRYLTIAADNREGLVFELRLRAPENAICKNIARASGQSGTCFTLRKKDVPLSVDPGARGHATILGGRLELKMTLVPYEKECEGSVTLYAINQRQTKLTRVRGTCGDKRYVEQR